MKNANISALFTAGMDGPAKKATLSLSTYVHDMAERNAQALRISKTRWLELLIENAIHDYSELGEESRDGEEISKDLVHPDGVGPHQINGGNAGADRAVFRTFVDTE